VVLLERTKASKSHRVDAHRFPVVIAAVGVVFENEGGAHIRSSNQAYLQAIAMLKYLGRRAGAQNSFSWGFFYFGPTTCIPSGRIFKELERQPRRGQDIGPNTMGFRWRERRLADICLKRFDFEIERKV
jgi:hypothetical protein